MNFRGNPELLKERNLIVQETAVAKDDDGKIKGRYVIAQIDQSLYNPKNVEAGKVPTIDSNPYIASHTKEHPNGGTYVAHEMYYNESQWQKMVEAAGKKSTEIDGKTVLGIKADITQIKSPNKVVDGKKPQDLIINTAKPMGPTSNPRFGKTVLDKQAAVTTSAKAFAATQREAKAAQMEKTAEAEVTTEAQADAPDV